MRNVVIIGAGENGYLVKGILVYDRGIKVIGFLDDVKDGKDILGKVGDLPKYQKKGCYFFLSIGPNSVRRKMFCNLQNAGVKFINAVHPSAVVEPDVQLGVNIIIGALSYVNVGSKIGDNTFIFNGCIVDHDNQIGQHCNLVTGAVFGGGVKIGDETFVGLNSTIRDHVTIGGRTVIGMGSVVVKDMPSGVVAFGCPAKIIKRLK